MQKQLLNSFGKHFHKKYAVESSQTALFNRPYKAFSVLSITYMFIAENILLNLLINKVFGNTLEIL